MATFRSAEVEARYQAVLQSGAHDIQCPLCSAEPVHQFTHWKIVHNAFPYDKIARRHDMLVAIRHAKEDELTTEELEELTRLKRTYAHEQYEYLLEAAHRKKSVPAHFHLHLIDAKD